MQERIWVYTPRNMSQRVSTIYLLEQQGQGEERKNICEYLGDHLVYKIRRRGQDDLDFGNSC